MRRLLTFAAFLLIISVVPVCAQRGGGHASGGSHGGFSGGGHASFGGGHAFSGGHASFSGRASGATGLSGSRFTSHSALGLRSYNRGYRYRGAIGGYGYRGRCYGYGCGYPYYGYAGIDPYWWWDSYSNDQNDAEQRAMANDMNQENLDEQQQLGEQDQQAHARPMNRPQPESRASAQTSIDPPTVLVYRDQHQREIQNYAIVGSTLWAFTPQRTEKIPLAELDLPATTKVNENRGVDFRLPRSTEGQ